VGARNYLKTILLLAGLSGLLLLVGQLLGDRRGLTIALVLAVALNAGSYFFSDKLALASSGARLVGETEAPWLDAMVGELAARMKLPMPRLYLSPSPQPNAFATGRSPRHAAVAVTQGILSVLDERELRAVLAHELSHVANRDILISSIAATIATAITYVAQLGFYLGGPDDEDAPNPLAALLLVLLAPIAALIIQLAISRSREFGADATGGQVCGDPIALASALRKIEAYARRTPPATRNPSTAPLFIINPFRDGIAGFARLFSTHPPTEERIRRLRALAGLR
jgi:heat shock protein HtpX